MLNLVTQKFIYLPLNRQFKTIVNDLFRTNFFVEKFNMFMQTNNKDMFKLNRRTRLRSSTVKYSKTNWGLKQRYDGAARQFTI